MPHAISRVGGLVAEQGAEDLGEAYQRASRPSDLRYLADNMRANDVAEVMACSGCTLTKCCCTALCTACRVAPWSAVMATLWACGA